MYASLAERFLYHRKAISYDIKKGPVIFSQVLSFLIKLFSEISSSALSNNINFDLSRILHFTFDLLGDIMGH